MRVMLDTNVLLSAIVFPNNRMEAVIYKASLDHQLVISSYIIDELLEVTRRKFENKVKDIDIFLARLPYEMVYTPQEPQPGLFDIRDMDDYPVLYSAILEDVDLFVTGDIDFRSVDIEKPRLLLHQNF
jgi:putative PIN family toxin of toxin-antitoxin system